MLSGIPIKCNPTSLTPTPASHRRTASSWGHPAETIGATRQAFLANHQNETSHSLEEEKEGPGVKNVTPDMSQRPTLVPGIGLELGLLKDVHEEATQVRSAAILFGLQERLRAGKEHVHGGAPGPLLDVTRRDDAQLLVSFIV